ncbi:lantibiotic dehydratase C-terminal domain-containing protein [Streptomyces albogriseolus]|uniref:lantibiotic dehydratase C-terminal domain-containing protein n=1 Tax=Streptomyces albogriseolus TaxID=1887 RepID=UPI0036B4418F
MPVAVVGPRRRPGGAWFARYRSLQETDHLRIRVPTGTSDGQAATLRALTAWTRQLAEDGLASQLIPDGHRPETGRHGTGAASGRPAVCAPRPRRRPGRPVDRVTSSCDLVTRSKRWWRPPG